MNKLNVKRKLLFSSFFALVILLNLAYSSGFLLSQKNQLLNDTNSVLDLSVVGEEIDDQSDEKRAEEYALYAEELDELVHKGKMSLKTKERLLDRFELAWL